MSAQAEQTHDRRVAFIGDSFVAGVGDPTGMGWVGA
jgi:acyl-CoA thioesterase-1